MIFTARQLEELLKSSGGGQITLPYRARLTPLAQDFIKHRNVKIGYAETEAPTASQSSPTASRIESGRWMWWSDGPCGPAKAALMTVSREANFNATEINVDAKRIVDAIKTLATEINAGRIEGGILLVGNGAHAMLYANRCPALRAVLGTCLEAVEQGVRLVAANVLVIEHPYKTLQQTKTLLARFVRGKRELAEDVRRQLEDLSSCA